MCIDGVNGKFLSQQKHIYTVYTEKLFTQISKLKSQDQKKDSETEGK